MCGTCQRCGNHGVVRDVMLGVPLGGWFCMVCAVAVRQEKTLWHQKEKTGWTVRARPVPAKADKPAPPVIPGGTWTAHSVKDD